MTLLMCCRTTRRKLWKDDIRTMRFIFILFDVREFEAFTMNLKIRFPK